MQAFLEKLVTHLCSKYGDNLDELCIVLPNRRAGLFLKTHFANNLKKTFWSPEVFATEDFVSLLAELEIVDTTTLLFELYETVKDINNNEIKSFDEFGKWGQILLSDINEIDLYLVDGEKLFGNLKDIKELETWSLNTDESLTDFQKQYLSFWQLLGSFYFDFKNRLLKKRYAYQGLAYKIVASAIEEKVNKHPWKKIIFAGFNALNNAEVQIIEKLLIAGRAEIIWDVDSYYAKDIKQEAGKFFRKYNLYESFKNNSDKSIVIDENLLATGKKNITIIGVAKNVAQAKVAGNLISDIQINDPSLQNTALVLADENLLFPVLHSLPENVKNINLTMGYPLNNTPLAGYIELVFSLHVNAMKFSKGKNSFYYKDLLKLVSHPYSNLLIFKKGKFNSLKSFISDVQKKNIVFASYSTIEKIIIEKQASVAAVLMPIFSHWKSPNDSISCILYLIEELKNGIIEQGGETEKNKTNLELEYLFSFSKIIKRIQSLMIDYPQSIIDIITLQNTLKQIVRGTSLPFYGEPLKGLQVMGMLETRTLDFENIILLSCNEDILPSGKTMNSFIPMELKRYFGLPTYNDKDAIFSYHFYRLLQRAKNIYLVYNTESDALGSGEKSRFLTQLLHELPKVNANVLIEEKLVNIPVNVNNSSNLISIYKTDYIIEKLNAKALTGFSPTLLNTYRNCSLQFYFKAVAELKEAREVEETIGADKLGDAIHEVLEKLYMPFLGKNISSADIKEFKKNVEAYTISFFETLYSKSEISYGKNLLTIKVALKFLNNFLNSEINFINKSMEEGRPLMIKKVEEQLSSNLIVGERTIKIYGKADRIDAVGSVLRIIDYKTGVVDNKELKVEEWGDLQSKDTLAKCFQLLTYAWLYQKMNPEISDNMVSGIITFRELSAGLKTVKIEGNEFLTMPVLAIFEEQLKIILSDIFNPEKEFKQTDEIENCKYCAFKWICNR